jgi:hypothetical protein
MSDAIVLAGWARASIKSTCNRSPRDRPKSWGLLVFMGILILYVVNRYHKCTKYGITRQLLARAALPVTWWVGCDRDIPRSLPPVPRPLAEVFRRMCRGPDKTTGRGNILEGDLDEQ